MSRFWVGTSRRRRRRARWSRSETVQRKLETRRRSRSPRKEPPKKPGPGRAGRRSWKPVLDDYERWKLFAYDGYNLIRELVSLLSASRTCRPVGAGPRTMITSGRGRPSTLTDNFIPAPGAAAAPRQLLNVIACP